MALFLNSNPMRDHKDIPAFDELHFHGGDKINIHEKGRKINPGDDL